HRGRYLRHAGAGGGAAPASGGARPRQDAPGGDAGQSLDLRDSAPCRGGGDAARRGTRPRDGEGEPGRTGRTMTPQRLVLPLLGAVTLALFAASLLLGPAGAPAGRSLAALLTGDNPALALVMREIRLPR